MNDPPMFEVGDLVRLKRGWTAMEVIHLTNNAVFACYAPEAVRAYERDGRTNPSEYADQIRCSEEFVPWSVKEARRQAGKAVNRFKNQTRHVLKDEPSEETDDMAKQKTLYSWRAGDKEAFGHHIGTMPDGRWVMAPANGGDPVTGQPEEFTEVVPYSILISNMSNAGQRDVHVWVDQKENLQVGDLILWSNGDFVRVKKIDTKSKDAFQWVDGTVIQGRVIAPKE